MWVVANGQEPMKKKTGHPITIHPSIHIGALVGACSQATHVCV